MIKGGGLVYIFLTVLKAPEGSTKTKVTLVLDTKTLDPVLEMLRIVSKAEGSIPYCSSSGY